MKKLLILSLAVALVPFSAFARLDDAEGEMNCSVEKYFPIQPGETHSYPLPAHLRPVKIKAPACALEHDIDLGPMTFADCELDAFGIHVTAEGISGKVSSLKVRYKGVEAAVSGDDKSAAMTVNEAGGKVAYTVECTTTVYKN